MVLFATHWYSPLSVLLTFVIVNCLLSCEKLILDVLLVSTGDPFLVHDIVGAGFPVALQDKVTFFPSVAVVFWGCVVILGRSVTNETIIVITGKNQTCKKYIFRTTCQDLIQSKFNVPWKLQCYHFNKMLTNNQKQNFTNFCFWQNNCMFRAKAGTAFFGFDQLTCPNTLYLHCISSVAASDVAFPTLLFATHRYSPLSVLLTFVIVSCLLSAEKLILDVLLVSKGNPFLVHDIVGTGFPSALQDKLTLSPSTFVSLWGSAVILGWSVILKQAISTKNKTIMCRIKPAKTCFH